VSEAPFQLASNVVSRQSHYRHEGTPSEYDQCRELYVRVMSETERADLHLNTATLLKKGEEEVKLRYLTQLYAVHPDYAKGVLALMPPQHFDLKRTSLGSARHCSDVLGARTVGEGQDGPSGGQRP
jgi:catalase